VTTSSQRYVPRRAPQARFGLQVESGPDAGATVIVTPDADAVLVGTSSVCQLRLTDPEVSRRHLRLECEGSRLRVTDLQSTNGTLLGGVAIIEAWAEPGQSLTIGSSSIRVVTVEGTTTQGAGRASDRFGGFLGGCAELQRLYPLLERLAESEVSIV